MTRSWTARTDSSTVYRRASGRRRYNKMRQEQAADRRALLLHLISSGRFGRLDGWGVQKRLAVALGVHPSTVSRDISRIMERMAPLGVCPKCGGPGREEGLPVRALEGLKQLLLQQHDQGQHGD